MTATTWDPNNKNANVTLSNGNLTAVSSSGTAAAAATRKISGLTYGEFVMGSALSGSVSVGFAAPSFPNGSLLGTSGTLAVGYEQNGNVLINNATVSTIATYAATNRVDWAINPQLGLVWFRVNGGNWNNSGAANPATNAGGISLATLSGINLWPACSMTSVANQSVTANFSTANFVGTPPSGYVTVDTIQTSAICVDSGEALNSTSSPPTPAHTTSSGRAVGGQVFSSPSNDNTAVSGIIDEGVLPVGGRLVLAYDCKSGVLLGSAISSLSGAYSIPCLGRSLVRIVATDPFTFNDQVLSLMAPG